MLIPRAQKVTYLVQALARRGLNHLRMTEQRSAIWVAIGSVGSALITAVTFRWVGAAVGVQGFGEATLFYSAVLLAVSCTAGSLAQGLARLTYDASGKEDAADCCATAFALTAGAGLIAATVACGLFAVGPLATSIGFLLPLSLSLAFCGEGHRTIAIAQLSGVGYFRDAAIVQFVDVTCRPPLVLVFAAALSDKAGAYVVGYSIGSLLSGLLSWLFVVRRVGIGRPTRAWASRQLRYSFPLVSNGVFGWLSNAGDRYVVAAATDVASAGAYVAAVNLGGRPALMLGAMCETYFRPALYAAVVARDRTKTQRTLRRWFAIQAAFVVLSGIAFWTMQEPLLRLFLPPEFRAAARTVFFPGFVAFALLSFGYLPQRINYALATTWRVTFVEVAGVVTMLAFVYAGGQLLGLRGVVIGLGISCAARGLLAAVFAALGLRERFADDHV